MLIPWRVPQKIAKNPMVYSGEIPIKKGMLLGRKPTIFGKHVTMKVGQAIDKKDNNCSPTSELETFPS